MFVHLIVVADTMESADDDQLLREPPPLDAVARAEFEDDFLHTTDFGSAARRRAKHGLRTSRLRSLHWRIFLGNIDAKDIGKWSTDLTRNRDEYNALLRRFMVTPSSHEQDAQQRAHVSAASADLTIHNPLSTSSESVWHQYFTNSELCNTIMLDVNRTHPDSKFFADKSIQSLMLNVLFVWAKLHPLYEYRQGMNELLAAIVFTVFKDTRKVTIAHAAVTNSNGVDGTALLAALLDRHFAEHDIFHLFERVMAHMSPFFAKIERSSNAASNAAAVKAVGDGDINVLFDEKKVETDSSPIIVKCNLIHHTLLSQLDPPLYKHLNAHDVQPQLYALRWYRLLFSREFHIEDVRVIWDVLFSQSTADADGDGFVLAELLCVAMLYYVRQQLLNGDNTFCLKRLLKFPPVEDIRVIIDRALHFRNAIKHGHSQYNNHNATPHDEPATATATARADDPLSAISGYKKHVTTLINSGGSVGATNIRRSNSATSQSKSSSADSMKTSSSSASLTIQSPSPSPSSTPAPLSPQVMTSQQLIALDMADEVNAVVSRLSHELERVHKQKALSELTENNPLAHNAEWSGAEYSLQSVMTAIAQLKHVREVLSGRLAYQPHHRVGIDLDDHSAVTAAALSPTSAPAATSTTPAVVTAPSQIFFVPKTSSAPAERLAKLLAAADKTPNAAKASKRATLPTQANSPAQPPSITSPTSSDSLFEKAATSSAIHPKLNHLIGEQTHSKSVFD